MVKSHITDATGKKRGAAVDDQNALVVSISGSPPIATQKSKIYREYLKDSAGSSVMKVDGGTTNVEFYVSASATSDRYITTLSFLIADASAVLNEFGAITALTNGCQLYYTRVGETVMIHDALKTNWDFIRLCLGAPAFGATTNAFIASNVATTSEGVIPVLDFSRLLPPYGLKLDRGTNQRLVLKVRDNCSGVDLFDCIAYGFDRFE
jgi:hypothetical protein